jgi:small subunit ribosomal protein S6e
MKIVVSDKKTGQAYLASPANEVFVGKKIGDTVKLDELGLTGYEGKITGGSDKEGFPMNVSMVGTARRKILTGNAEGFKASRKGERKRVSVRGNTISNEIVQVNLAITKEGSVTLESVFPKKELSPEEQLSAKERMIKKSLESAGSAELGSGIKKPKH